MPPSVRRYPLGAGRELVISETRDLLFLSVREALASGACRSGPLALRMADVEAVRSALAHLVETAPAEPAT